MGNVKRSHGRRRKEPVIRYLTIPQWRKLLDVVDCWEHKILIQLLYELGCRVGEFVRIQLLHVDLEQSTVFFPAEHTKTRHERVSHLPRSLLNDLKELLRRRGDLRKRAEMIRRPDAFLMESASGRPGMSANRVRQIFRVYIIRAGLDRAYGKDSYGRSLHTFSVHSLRHSHIMHAIHDYHIPVPIVQKQVGHKTLDATMAYCQPSDEMVGKYYEQARSRGNMEVIMSHDRRGVM
jgi:integrase